MIEERKRTAAIRAKDEAAKKRAENARQLGLEVIVLERLPGRRRAHHPDGGLLFPTVMFFLMYNAARSERRFRLMMPDLAVELLMPPLMEKIERLAPNVTIDVVPWRGPAIFSAEFARTIDLVISIGDAFKGFHRQLLYTDRDALAVRRGRRMPPIPV